MLICEHLKKTYQKKCVVDDLSFSVRKGEAFALLGSNGAGKTTTIKMVLNLIPRDAGTIEIGENVRIGYSPETPYFHPFLTGREVLEFYGGLQGISKEELRREIPGLLRRAGLAESSTKVKHYSKGMLQRLALSQALLGDPGLLILDEPTAGLDPKGRDEILDQIAGLHQEMGITVILVSHSMEDVAKYVERIIVMNKGSVLYDDVPKEVFRHYKELEQVGLAAPQVTYIMQALREKGIPVHTDVTTISEARDEILQILK